MDEFILELPSVDPEKQAELKRHYEIIDSFYDRFYALMDDLEPYYQDDHATGLYCKVHDITQDLVNRKVELIRQGLLGDTPPCTIKVAEGQYTLQFPDPISGLGMRRFVYARNRKEGIAKTYSLAAMRNMIYETVGKAVSDLREQGVMFKPIYPCVIDFNFRFKRKIMDVDNYNLAMLINAFKLSGLILADHYRAMRYTVTGIEDKANTGITVVIRKTKERAE